MAFERLFPEQIDNNYQGHFIAKWVLVPITVLTIIRSLIHMFATDGGAQSIASIPLDTFTTSGANTVITVFALMGLSQLMIGFFYAIVLWRYQALIPLMYVSLIFEYIMRMLTRFYTPGIEITHIPPGAILTLVMVPLSMVMMYLSLQSIGNDKREKWIRG